MSSRSPLSPTISHCCILEKSGVSMGVVYKAEDTRLGCFGALKFLPDDVPRNQKAFERFRLELLPVPLFVRCCSLGWTQALRWRAAESLAVIASFRKIMNNRNLIWSLLFGLIATVTIVAGSRTVVAQGTDRPWMNPKLSPAERADLVLKQLTLDEKLALLHGNGMAHVENWQMPLTYLSNGGAGYVEGIKRLGIPPLVISDAAYGVRDSGLNGRYSTAMPSVLGAASSWDQESACEYGEVIGRELRAQGYDMTLGGGVNLTREPRNG